MHSDLLVGAGDAQVQHGGETSGTQEKALGGKAGGWSAVGPYKAFVIHSCL